MISPNYFSSFFMGGFECTYHLNETKRFDALLETMHEHYCREDYFLLSQLGIYTVREGLAWYEIDNGLGSYNFKRFEKMMAVGRANQVQQIWDLNHFDYPEDSDPFSNDFIIRFAAYAKAAVKMIRKYNAGTIFIVPFNEISFFSWIAGEVGVWAPFAKNKGLELKMQLVKAVLAAIDEIRTVDSDVKFIHTDPIMHRVPKQPASRAVHEYTKLFREIRFQAWDMITGKIFPELGGHPSYLDIIGINYYFHNQEYVVQIKNDYDATALSCKTIPWNSKHRQSFYNLCQLIFKRYRKPMLIAETGCFGKMRKRWWTKTLSEIQQAIDNQLPICGVCAYPVIDRHDWDHGGLTNSGLWDFQQEDTSLQRIPHHDSIALINAFIAKNSV